MGDQRTGTVRSEVEPDEDVTASSRSPLTLAAILSLVVIGLFLVTRPQQDVETAPPTTTPTTSTTEPVDESVLRLPWSQATALPSRATGFSGYLGPNPIRIGNELVIVVWPGSASRSQVLWSSADDGASWTEQLLPEEMEGGVDVLTDQRGTVYALGESGDQLAIWRSTDLSTWDEWLLDSHRYSSQWVETYNWVTDVASLDETTVLLGTRLIHVDYWGLAEELRLAGIDLGVDPFPSSLDWNLDDGLLVAEFITASGVESISVDLPPELATIRWSLVDPPDAGLPAGQASYLQVTGDDGLTWSIEADIPFPIAGSLIDTDAGFVVLGAASPDGDIGVWRSVDGGKWVFGGTANGLGECLGEDALVRYPVFLGDLDGGVVFGWTDANRVTLCRGDGLLRWETLELPVQLVRPMFSVDGRHLLVGGSALTRGGAQELYYLDDAGWRPVDLPFTPRSGDNIVASVERGKIILFHRKNVGLEVWTAPLP